MCGIAGLYAVARDLGQDALLSAARACGDRLTHRGPDAGDTWVDAAAGIALAHRRLSIVDLSAAGAQPMVSHDGRFVIAYNGEVYNAPDLRDALAAAGHTPPWRGHSDTEVLVEACAVWGVAETCRRLIGMFAFALWDRETRTLTLARDRLGIKPLYWGKVGGRVAFASELKALRTLPGFDGAIDRAALTAYLRYGYVPAPRSIYQGVGKVMPGTVITVTADGDTRESRYWCLAEVVRAGQAQPLEVSDDEAADRLEALLRDAVGRRMVSDVPLGAFLSGGIDSSTVAALMQAQSRQPVRTFSIGFDVPGYNEAHHAAAVAAHLGTDHTELYVDPGRAREVIPRLPEIYDEPFADASQIPTFLVSEMTRRHVTVALSGDGGDELFAGYSRHYLAATLWPRIVRLPLPVRRLAAAAIHAVPPATVQRAVTLLPARFSPFAAGDRLHKLADVLPLRDGDALYRRLVSQWDDPGAVVLGGGVGGGDAGGGAGRESGEDAVGGLLTDDVARMQYLDTTTYLPDDILTKVDRASMAVSLEARVPLLDHRVVEFAWTLPRRFKLRDGQGKWLLRRVLDRHVPRALLDRPKMGFAVPIESWLRGPLRDWAEDLLDEETLRADGVFAPGEIRRRWADHLSGRRNWQYALWGVLMFQAWRRHVDNG